MSCYNPDGMRTKNGFRAKDFTLDSTLANLAEIELTQRYPETGFALNTQSEMIVYISEGKVLFAQGEKKIFTKGSAVRVKPNEKYFWLPLKKVRMIVFSTPPWTPEQHKNVQ